MLGFTEIIGSSSVVLTSSSRVWDNVSEGSTLIFGGTRFFRNAVYDSWNEACGKIQLDSSSRFDIVPACDRETDRQTHDDSIYCASIGVRGKNRILLISNDRLIEYVSR